jgi:hypothetical protein
MNEKITFQEGLDLVDKATQKLVEANQMVVDSIQGFSLNFMRKKEKVK